VALGVYRPPPPVDVDRLAQVQDERLCVVLDTIAALAFQGITLPPDPTTEDIRAVRDANTQLAQLAEQVRGLLATREVC
jgi:histidine ammonia-lyase